MPLFLTWGDPYCTHCSAHFTCKSYHRVVLNEAYRARYAKRVSFEREFGSSMDPNMYKILYERTRTGIQVPFISGYFGITATYDE